LSGRGDRRILARPRHRGLDLLEPGPQQLHHLQLRPLRTPSPTRRSGAVSAGAGEAALHAESASSPPFRRGRAALTRLGSRPVVAPGARGRAHPPCSATALPFTGALSRSCLAIRFGPSCPMPSTAPSSFRRGAKPRDFVSSP